MTTVLYAPIEFSVNSQFESILIILVSMKFLWNKKLVMVLAREIINLSVSVFI